MLCCGISLSPNTEIAVALPAGIWHLCHFGLECCIYELSQVCDWCRWPPQDLSHSAYMKYTRRYSFWYIWLMTDGIWGLLRNSIWCLYRFVYNKYTVWYWAVRSTYPNTYPGLLPLVYPNGIALDRPPIPPPPAYSGGLRVLCPQWLGVHRAKSITVTVQGENMAIFISTKKWAKGYIASKEEWWGNWIWMDYSCSSSSVAT